MSMQHTPGPWRAVGGDVFDSENGLVVSLTNSFRRDKVSRQRDAADPVLIAAAPELLAALVAMRDLRTGTEMTHEDAYDSMFKSGGRDAWQALDLAIAKATGAA